MKKLLFAALFVFAISSLSFGQRTLITKGDQYAGAKLALGSVAGASWGLVGSYEMGLQDNIGVGATVGYSGYSEDISAGFYTGNWSYSNILILANGNYHFDLLKNEKIDTWGGLSIGYNVASVSWEFTKNTLNLPEPATVSAGGFVVGLSANGRYFINDNLSIAASLGFGMGILQIGIDYKL